MREGQQLLLPRVKGFGRIVLTRGAPSSCPRPMETALWNAEDDEGDGPGPDLPPAPAVSPGQLKQASVQES